MGNLDAAFVEKSLIACLALTAVTKLHSSSSVAKDGSSNGGVSDSSATGDFRRFQRLYLLVYLTASFADWLQGPYLYAIYDSYGILPGDNARLYMVGFGSSMILGTVCAAWADRIGRRKAAMLYSLLYVVNNLTKHFNWYAMLVFGHVLSGMAISLLFSVFDAWLVCEHHSRCFDPDLLSNTYSLAGSANAMGAIVAGITAQLAVDVYRDIVVHVVALPSPITGSTAMVEVHAGGYCSPFDMSSIVLGFNLVFVVLLWTENYGERRQQLSTGDLLALSKGSACCGGCRPSSLPRFLASISGKLRQEAQGLWQGLLAVFKSSNILHCGLVCALFEAAMFIFTFQWTPAITQEGFPEPPYGTAFAALMVPCMLGGTLFQSWASRRSVKLIGKAVMVLAAASHAVPVLTGDTQLRFVAFLVFELAVGMYFPVIGTLKGKLVPDAARATIYSLFRVPLNLIVVLVLGGKCGVVMSFSITTCLLAVAFLALRLISDAAIPNQRSHLDIGPPAELEVSVEEAPTSHGGKGPWIKHRTQPSA